MCFNIVSGVLTVDRGVMYCENALGAGAIVSVWAASAARAFVYCFDWATCVVIVLVVPRANREPNICQVSCLPMGAFGWM